MSKKGVTSHTRVGYIQYKTSFTQGNIIHWDCIYISLLNLICNAINEHVFGIICQSKWNNLSFKMVSGGKGAKKRSKTYFKRGNKLTPIRKKDNSEKPKARQIIRTDRHLQEFVKSKTDNGLLQTHIENDGVIEENIDLPVIRGDRIDRTVLRPPKEIEDVNTEDNSGINVIVQKDLMCNMFNEAYRDHATKKRTCQGDLRWDDINSKRFGLAWKVVIHCTRCRYRSKQFKLYDEVESGTKGPKPAAINMGIQTGVMRHGMSNSGLREILTSANIPSPSLSTMQRTANRVGEIVVEATQEHFEVVCQQVKTYNESIGLDHYHPVPVEVDTTYNNPMFRAGDTPFQAGTQTSTICAEKLTGKNYIIALKTNAKICSCANKEEHQPDCTANLDPDSTIGNEGQYLSDVIDQVNQHDVFVGEVTMDGDSSAKKRAATIRQTRPDIQVKPKYCTRHLTRNVEKLGHRIPWSERMFPGRTQAMQAKAKGRFVHDIGDRVHAEFMCAHKALEGSVEKLNKKLINTKEAIIDCYRGDHRLCDEHSYVCSEDKRWWRPYINTNPRLKAKEAFFREASRKDLEYLRQMIDMRFSEKAVELTSNNCNTNKSEASMKGIKKCVPSQLTFSRNYSPRAHIAVHGMNSGPGTSIAEMCQAVGAPISDKSAVGKAAKSMDKRKDYHSRRKKSDKYKQDRSEARQKRYALYDEKNEKEGYNNDNVINELYIPPTRTKNRQPIPHVEDHCYQSNKIQVIRK